MTLANIIFAYATASIVAASTLLRYLRLSRTALEHAVITQLYSCLRHADARCTMDRIVPERDRYHLDWLVLHRTLQICRAVLNSVAASYADA